MPVGAPPRAIGPRPLRHRPSWTPLTARRPPAAVDLLRLSLLAIPGVTAALDLALGHMEGAVTVPAGGIRCNIPVSKVASVDPVTVGNDFAYIISIPSDAALFDALFNCDLINISAVGHRRRPRAAAPGSSCCRPATAG